MISIRTQQQVMQQTRHHLQPCRGCALHRQVSPVHSGVHSRASPRWKKGLQLHNVPSALPPQLLLNEVAQIAEFEVETDLFYLPTWTGDQIAGLLFGALMLASFLLAQSFDAAVARQQREELGICQRCGGVNDPSACQEGDCPMRKGK